MKRKISLYEIISELKKNTTKEFEEIAETIEKLYIKYILYVKNGNHDVCSLEKSKKVALCSQIFKQIALHTDYNIMLNKVAFFINTAKCEPKPVHFVKNIFFSEEIIMQEMYPCYGRTDPVRTNFIIDDNYDKFYISNGLTDDSIFVYIHEFDVKSDRYIVYNHQIIFQLSKLTNIFIWIQEVANELELNYKAIRSNEQEEIELIYIREKENSEQEDKLSRLNNSDERIAICNMILSQSIYREYHQIFEGAFYIFQKYSVKNKLKMISEPFQNNLLTSQRMIPCFTNTLTEYGNSLKTGFLPFFYISEGPRSNSIFVYIRNEFPIKNITWYHLIEFVENVFIDITKSTHNYQSISSEEVKFDPETTAYVTRIWNLLNLKEQYMNFKLLLYNAWVTRILKVRKNLQVSARRNSSAKNKISISDQLNDMFVLIKTRILSVITDKINNDMQKDNTSRRKYLILDDESLVLENQIMSIDVNNLLLIVKRYDLEDEIKRLDMTLNFLISQIK